jgi:hypothetical protein
MNSRSYENKCDYNRNIRSLAQKLSVFSSTLSPKDKEIFVSIILERLDPLDRIKAKGIHSVLNNDEITLLNTLIAENLR